MDIFNIKGDGINLDDMYGFAKCWDEHEHIAISWDNVKDPITPLLNHSDCDGELTPEECRTVAPRLRELVANWKEDDYDKAKAIELAEGMELAAKNNELLEFI